MLKQLILLLILLPFAAAGQPAAGPANQDSPPDICQEPDNILPNCNFNNGFDGWQPFTEDGAASFNVLQGGGECHAPLCPAGYIVVEDHFVGGFYQQVPVAKGNTYYANVVWLVFDSLANDGAVHNATGGIGRRLGIDPYGGVDPRSSNIIWGPENWRNDCKICANQEVTATAQADTITLFLRIDDRWKARAAEQGFAPPPSKDQFWIDDLGMKQVAGEAAPAPTEPSPTDTPPPPPPPTETPVPVATDTPLPAPTATEPPPVETPVEAAGPISPVATPTAAKVVAPPPTLTPSATPTPTETPQPRQATPTRLPRPSPTPESSLLSAGLLGAAGATACMGGLFLVVVAVVVAGLVWLYRLGWGEATEDVLGDEDFEEFEEIDFDTPGQE